MSGIYNIGQCVMPWWISNCEQGQVLVQKGSAMHAARQLPGSRPTDVDVAPSVVAAETTEEFRALI